MLDVCAECGGLRDLPCIDENGLEVCFVPNNVGSGRSGPNGNGVCTPCGNNGRTVCNSAISPPLAFDILCTELAALLMLCLASCMHLCCSISAAFVLVATHI